MKVTIWWICSIISFMSLSTLILHFDNPDRAPLVGAITTISSFFSFTWLKSKQDGYAQEFEGDLIEVISRNFEYEVTNVRREVAAEVYERKDADFKIYSELKRRVDEMLRRDSLPMISSRLERLSVERPLESVNRVKMSIPNYKQVCSDYREAIREHRTNSRRLEKMEALSIIYGAAVSAFGADFIRWWNG